jgi:hypothetical protein
LDRWSGVAFTGQDKPDEILHFKEGRLVAREAARDAKEGGAGKTTLLKCLA